MNATREKAGRAGRSSFRCALSCDEWSAQNPIPASMIPLGSGTGEMANVVEFGMKFAKPPSTNVVTPAPGREIRIAAKFDPNALTALSVGVTTALPGAVTRDRPIWSDSKRKWGTANNWKHGSIHKQRIE